MSTTGCVTCVLSQWEEWRCQNQHPPPFYASIQNSQSSTNTQLAQTASVTAAWAPQCSKQHNSRTVTHTRFRHIHVSDCQTGFSALCSTRLAPAQKKCIFVRFGHTACGLCQGKNAQALRRNQHTGACIQHTSTVKGPMYSYLGTAQNAPLQHSTACPSQR